MVVKRKQLGLELARRRNLPRAAAQDEVDEVVATLIRRLRKGEPIKLPGIGKIVPKDPEPRDSETNLPPVDPSVKRKASTEESGNQ